MDHWLHCFGPEVGQNMVVGTHGGGCVPHGGQEVEKK
jgi:hypothetical protein